VNEEERLQRGKALRRQVLGDAYVDRPGPQPTAFQAAYRAFAEEHAWSNVWIRPGLGLRERSMVTLAILLAGARWGELEIHLRGAVNNGVTKDEIIEIVLQAGVYAGIPIASHAFKVCDQVFAEAGTA
jgi:4-carboxymuconolactone decarboxylase